MPNNLLMPNSSKIILILTIAYMGYVNIFKVNEFKNISERIDPKNSVVLYSLTTCGICKALKQQLNNVGIPFNEIQVDELSPTEQQELFNRLINDGVSNPGGVPFLRINGKWITHRNITLTDISNELILKK